jgi:hypothetical protein
MDDVVFGFDDVAGYESKANGYFGATAGRVANRIAGGKFSLDGKEHTPARRQFALKNSDLLKFTCNFLEKIIALNPHWYTLSVAQTRFRRKHPESRE